jgi:hypothetical protein
MSNNANLAPVAAEGAPDAFVRQAGPSTMQITAGPAPRTIKYPFVVTGLTMTQSSKTVDFDDVGRLSQFGMFESVRLLSLSFTVILAPGSTKVLYYRIDGTAESSDTAIQSLTGPISGLVPGAQYGTTVIEVPLPSDHSFGRELKANALGNETPKLHFLYRGGTPASTAPDVTIRGSIELELAGVGLVNALTF